MKRILIILLIFFVGINYKTVCQTATAEKKCLDCHGKLMEKKFIHTPVRDSCLKCHQPNGKSHPQEDVEGFTLTKKVPKLCFTCHDEKIFTQDHIHPPVKEGDCFSCHDIHSSKNEHLLVVAPPSLCFSCHTDLKDSISHSFLTHQAVNIKKSCLNCHSPHSSSQKKVLLDEQPALCFSCHNKPIESKNRIIPDMKQMVEKSKYVHGAIENKGCTICHNPHASKKSFLWKKTFPVGNYAEGKKENYALCFQCHESEMIQDSLTTEATGFRKGNRNLHYLHVHKEKGRVCLNCHNPHASNSLFLITNKTKFGSWEMPIIYTRIEKGGSCKPGCHEERQYKR